MRRPKYEAHTKYIHSTFYHDYWMCNYIEMLKGMHKKHK